MLIRFYYKGIAHIMPRGLRSILLPRKKEDAPDEALPLAVEPNEAEDASTGPSEAVEVSFNSGVSGGKNIAQVPRFTLAHSQ